MVWGGWETPCGDTAVKMEKSPVWERPGEGRTGLGDRLAGRGRRACWCSAPPTPTPRVLAHRKWVEAMNELASKTVPEASTPLLPLPSLRHARRPHVEGGR